jgi:hypothetical protein
MPAKTEQRAFAPKWYLNGFPKSGLHLVALMLEGLETKAQTGGDGLTEGPWAGTFRNNAWSNEWMPMELVLHRIGNLQYYHYMKAHAGYTEDIDRFLYYLGVCHIFIYRDLRDVAVSQAHHILAEDEDRFRHPGRAAYEGMSFDEVLEAVIVGIEGPSNFVEFMGRPAGTGIARYEGVMERWELYAPWTGQDWVHKVRFEDARISPVKVAESIIRYGFRRWQLSHLHEVNVDEERVKAAARAMAAISCQTERSITFRKGNVGDWREEFTERHKQLFKESDVNGWLVRLGYEILLLTTTPHKSTRRAVSGRRPRCWATVAS